MFKYICLLVALFAVALAAPSPTPKPAYLTAGYVAPVVSSYAASPVVSNYAAAPIISSYAAAPVVSTYGSSQYVYGGAPLAYSGYGYGHASPLIYY